MSTSQSDLTIPSHYFTVFKPVESILVCTGVYNPQNDILHHLRTIVDHAEGTQHNLAVPETENSTHDLQSTMSRKNSFISYFDNRLNVPDLTVDNLSNAVDHILANLN